MKIEVDENKKIGSVKCTIDDYDSSFDLMGEIFDFIEQTGKAFTNVSEYLQVFSKNKTYSIDWEDEEKFENIAGIDYIEMIFPIK